MKFSIISGSSRKNSQSIKVARYIQKQLSKIGINDQYLLDLAVANIKQWDESFYADHTKFDEAWNEISKELKASDAVIIIAPEWNGSIPPALHNFMHLTVKGEFADKPAMIVGISSTGNGVYSVAELRSNGFKNSRINYIPHHVIVRNVESVLNDHDKHHNEADKFIQDRLNYSLQILKEYATGFIAIRNSIAVKNNPYNYGM